MTAFETDRYVDLPPHFMGLDPQKPIEMHQLNLPHWRQEGATYFFTARLSDSLPRQMLDQLQDEKQFWLEKNSKPHSDDQLRDFAKRVSSQVEKWLDSGSGSCAMANRENAKVISDTMKYFDGERYHLFASVVMSNHIHAIIKPLYDYDLDSIWESWKKFTATALRRRGVRIEPVWFKEGYDRIIRDVEHLRNVLKYIGQNPIKAGQTREACQCHLHPEWEAAGWSFDSET